MDDYDSPWKEVFDPFLQRCLAFFRPRIHDDIDWQRGFDFLDKELQQIVKDAELGGRVVDKLVKVWLKNGQEEWILIHIEIQTQPHPDFPKRVFVYNYRIFDRYNRKVVSLAILADDDPAWRPDTYGYSLWDFKIEMKFPVVKLLDYANRFDELEASSNPFAAVVMAHLKAMETRHDPDGRRAWKFKLVRGLYERNWTADEIRTLFRFIDWVMELPKGLAYAFWQDVQQLEKEK